MALRTGWQYRIVSSFGATILVVLSVFVANALFFQRVLTSLPVFGRLNPTVLAGTGLVSVASTTLLVVGASLMVLFKPRPRRILDTVSLTLQRVLGACLVLAAIGYFDYTYRLPRTTLLLTTVFLCVCLPAWFVAVRRRPAAPGERAVLVGDDFAAMAEVLETVDLEVVGYVAPTIRRDVEQANRESPIRFADGGLDHRMHFSNLDHLGGFARFEEVLIEHDVGTAVLAFEQPDRAEFFGALGTCHDQGVVAKIHRRHADSVLTNGIDTGELVEVELEPWDWQDRLIKRAFDVMFAFIGMALLMPVMVAIAIAIKLDSAGPVFYSQERTAEFGETFQVYKFRSMVTDAEAEGVQLSEEDAGGVDPRVTRVGRLLRQSHLDEVPQLWSILRGHMSVVGPRPERPELDDNIEGTVVEWRRRWFVKPGLTGLAQINGATGYEPERKLQYDIRYIQQQSFFFDMKVVLRQIWMVIGDTIGTAID